MEGNKKDPTGFSLVAHDEAEGMSEAGRAIFEQVCRAAREKGKRKELDEANVGRVLSGQRRVTRDLLMKVMNLAEIPEREREPLWDRYFGGPPERIAEVIRRSIIRIGGIREYAQQVNISRETLSWIQKHRIVTTNILHKLLSREQSFPWRDKELMTRWRHEYEEYYQRTHKTNLLAARVATLFEMRPKASRTEWVECGNAPESLAGMSKNKIRILLSALRHGKPAPWEEVDRVLSGMDCTLIERVGVAHAWLLAKRELQQAADLLADSDRYACTTIERLLHALETDASQSALVRKVRKELGAMRGIPSVQKSRTTNHIAEPEHWAKITGNRVMDSLSQLTDAPGFHDDPRFIAIVEGMATAEDVRQMIESCKQLLAFCEQYNLPNDGTRTLLCLVFTLRNIPEKDRNCIKTSFPQFYRLSVAHDFERDDPLYEKSIWRQRSAQEAD